MSPTRVTVDDDEQQLADLEADLRRLRSRLATTAVTGSHDEFTAAATPSTTYTLTYIPLSGTCLMALNGHVQREGTDYTVNYDTGLVTVSATQASGDKITFRYLITDWLVARSIPPDTAGPRTDNFNRANSSSTINDASDGGTWTVNAGTWGITSNRGVLVTDAAAGTPPHINGFNLISTDTGVVAQTVIVTSVRSSTSGDSAIWVSRDPTTGVGYFVDFDSSGTYFYINKAVSTGGSGPQHGPYTVTPWTAGSTKLKVSHNGAGVITVSQDTGGGFTTVGTWTDTLGGTENTTPHYGGTWCGLAEFTVGPNAWDDFSVTNP